MQRHLNTSEQGFTLVELLFCVAILGILVATAMPTFKLMTRQAYDMTAQSDYRNLKTALYNTLATPGTPTNFVMSRQRGPRQLAAPLQSVSLSTDTQVNITYATVRAAGRSPTVTIRMDVEHLSGTKSYRYTELNGVITEQVVNKP